MQHLRNHLLAVGLIASWPTLASEGRVAVAVKAAHLIDVKGERVISPAIVLIEGGRIAQVGTAVTIPTGTKVIDLGEATLLPGLIDAHVHLTSVPENSGYKELGVSLPRETLYGATNALKTLLAGFTSARNVGAGGYSDVALREAIDAGELPGPRLLVSGPPLGITGGHCDENLLPPKFHYREEGVADGPWEARTKAREVIKYGADLIKVCASGGVLSKGDQPGAPQYSLEELRAIVEEAHRAGRKVAAHAHGTQSIKEAIRAGVDSIEHASLIDDEGLSLAKERGTFLVMDIYNDDYILQEGLKMGMLPESIEKEKALGRLQRESFSRAVKAGVRLAFGTDAGVYPHGDNAKQFAFMVRYGMTPMQAIRAATLDAAELLGWMAKVGSIEPGKLADLIGVQGDPLTDVRALENVGFVMKAGTVVKDTLRPPGGS
ncbi:MAG: amidohydrolase family protein [Myxococcaceae bacterium]